MLNFTDDELSILYITALGYINDISEEISGTPKSSEDYPDLLRCKQDAVNVSQKLKTYLESVGIQFEVSE